MSAKIPKQLFATFVLRNEGGDQVRLGFVSPYGTDAAFEKRKKTQVAWAANGWRGKGGQSTSFEEKEDGSWVIKLFTRTWTPSGSVIINPTTEEEFPKELVPSVIDNELLPGFQISKVVRRCGWSSGSTVWRVVDPRGFELEISASNFARIVDCSTIENGVIKDRCIWARDGANNLLLPEQSDIYQAAVAETKRHNQSVSIKDLTPGDLVDVLGSSVPGGRATYLGQFYVQRPTYSYIMHQPGSSRRSDHVLTGIDVNGDEHKPKLCHLFQAGDGRVYYPSTPKISSIITKTTVPLDPQSVLQSAAMKLGSTTSYVGPTGTSVFTKRHSKDLYLHTKPASESNAQDWRDSLSKPYDYKENYSRLVIHNDRLWIAALIQERHLDQTWQYRERIVLFAVDIDGSAIRFIKNSKGMSMLFEKITVLQQLDVANADDLEVLDLYAVSNGEECRVCVGSGTGFYTE